MSRWTELREAAEFSSGPLTLHPSVALKLLALVEELATTAQAVAFNAAPTMLQVRAYHDALAHYDQMRGEEA